VAVGIPSGSLPDIELAGIPILGSLDPDEVCAAVRDHGTFP
jgi:hypothetical protein